MLNRRKNTPTVGDTPVTGKLSRPFTVATSLNQSQRTVNKEERLKHLRQVLHRCNEKFSQLAVKPHIYQTGEYCGVIRGKFYGARGVVRDVDFINDRVLVDLKSYLEPVWMDPGEIEPE